MKILIVGSRDRYEKFLPEKIRTGDFELVFAPRGRAHTGQASNNIVNGL